MLVGYGFLVFHTFNSFQRISNQCENNLFSRRFNGSLSGKSRVCWAITRAGRRERTKILSATEIAMRVINGVKNGSIILCHNNGLHTAEALPLIFSTLKNRGYEFVPISELIYKENYTIDHTGRQFSLK